MAVNSSNPVPRDPRVKRLYQFLLVWFVLNWISGPVIFFIFKPDDIQAVVLVTVAVSLAGVIVPTVAILVLEKHPKIVYLRPVGIGFLFAVATCAAIVLVPVAEGMHEWWLTILAVSAGIVSIVALWRWTRANSFNTADPVSLRKVFIIVLAGFAPFAVFMMWFTRTSAVHGLSWAMNGTVVSKMSGIHGARGVILSHPHRKLAFEPIDRDLWDRLAEGDWLFKEPWTPFGLHNGQRVRVVPHSRWTEPRFEGDTSPNGR